MVKSQPRRSRATGWWLAFIDDFQLDSTDLNRITHQVGLMIIGGIFRLFQAHPRFNGKMNKFLSTYFKIIRLDSFGWSVFFRFCPKPIPKFFPHRPSSFLFWKHQRPLPVRGRGLSPYGRWWVSISFTVDNETPFKSSRRAKQFARDAPARQSSWLACARERTWTSTSCDTRTSSVPGYQLQHPRKIIKLKTWSYFTPLVPPRLLV